MMKFLYRACFILCFLTMANLAFANNVRISDVSLTNDSTLTFNISWDNSWRNLNSPGNHDAVWIFIKRKGCTATRWFHTDLSANMADHVGSGLLEVYIDGKDQGEYAKGVFVRRKSKGAGSISNQTISLRLAGVGNDEFDYKIFGIEMVQVPAGAFYLGDGSSFDAFRTGNGNPYLVNSNGSIHIARGTGDAFYIYTNMPFTLPESWPKGFNEFYCMKYEISQQQYVDFLNSIAPDQATNRAFLVDANRIHVAGVWPNYTTNFPHRAMGNLAWPDLLAYLDWACLRPMTEMEYEKACRGPEYPVKSEFAWGTDKYNLISSIVNDGTATETCDLLLDTGFGVVNINLPSGGPMRSGFAAKPNTDRFAAGASYYGIMELSGNVAERVVTINIGSNNTSNFANSTIHFTSAVGDGELTASPNPGFADVTGWPWPNQMGSNVEAIAVRGGGFASGVTDGYVSTRNVAIGMGARVISYGGRGVR